MTREQAINYLYSSGFSEEQVTTIVKAFEPTTKNDLGVDKEQLKTMIRGLTKWYVKRDNTEVGEPNTAVGLLYDDVMFGIDRLPSVTPQEQEPRWISVSKQLPEESTAVLVWCPERKNIYCAYYEEKQWWIFGAYWEKITLDIIAWMPLPKAYREVEE